MTLTDDQYHKPQNGSTAKHPYIDKPSGVMKHNNHDQPLQYRHAYNHQTYSRPVKTEAASNWTIISKQEVLCLLDWSIADQNKEEDNSPYVAWLLTLETVAMTVATQHPSWFDSPAHLTQISHRWCPRHLSPF